jgi:hypothetical protein
LCWHLRSARTVNLGLVSTTIVGAALNRSIQLRRSIGILGIQSAIILLAHVATWLAIGVVMPPTFILTAMAIASISIQTYALVAPLKFSKLAIASLGVFGFKNPQLVTE